MSDTLLIRPLAPACGAEVFGIDLANPGTGELAQVHSALAQHAVLFFRDQRLTPGQQLEVTRLFGPVLRVPYIRHMAEHPDIIAVLKEADERQISTFGGTWHSDFSFLEQIRCARQPRHTPTGTSNPNRQPMARSPSA